MKVQCSFQEGSTNILIFTLDEEPWKKGHKAIFGYPFSFPSHCRTIQELEVCFNETEQKRALYYALKRLSVRGYSIAQMQKLLKQKLVSNEGIEHVIEECLRIGYLNDQAWMESIIRMQRARFKGPEAIRRKLRLSGIPEEQINQALASFKTNENQQQQILDLLGKKYKSRDLKNKRERDKVIAALMRRGFDWEAIRQVCFSRNDFSNDSVNEID